MSRSNENRNQNPKVARSAGRDPTMNTRFHANVIYINRAAIALLTAAVLMVGAALSVGLGGGASAESAQSRGPTWTSAGELELPRDYRTWVFLGSPLTPNALNNGKAGFPEYHNVYLQHEAFQSYRNNGTFPEGTILVKELQLTLEGSSADGSRVEASGRGYFPGALNGIDISVKDSKRFKDTNGWGFFNFGHHAPPYPANAKVQPKEACADCHTANATDMVFTKFYAPILAAE